LKTHEGGQKENIYLWYNKINEITVSRKLHIGPYVGLAAGFIVGVVYTAYTPVTHYYTNIMGNPEYSTSHPNWWATLAGAAIGAALGVIVESVVRKKIKMKINHNHDEYLKYKPMLEAYLNQVQ